MNPLGPNTTVALVLGATDIRKAIDGLSVLVAEHPERDAFSRPFVRVTQSRPEFSNSAIASSPDCWTDSIGSKPAA